MGFFDRLANVIRGMFGVFVGGVEQRNPEAVYEAAINERVTRHKELKQAVGNIVFLRNKLSDELQTKERELRDALAQLPVAVQEGEDEVAILLIQKKDALTARIEELSRDLAKVEAQAEEAKAGLVSFQGEIAKLRREKEEMLTAKTTAEARIEIQESLSGLSVEADVAALENVRTSIQKLKAEADLGAEIEGASLDAKLARIKDKAADAAARGQLEELKKQAAARQAQAEGGVVPKTM